MKIEVKGHSGCQIDVVREGKNLFVYKSSRDPKYLNRLVLQAEKQRNAALLRMQHIRVPEVQAIEKTPEYVSVKMDYVYSRNFVEYFEHAGFEQVEYLIEALKNYIDYEVNNSRMQEVELSLFSKKFSDVKDKTISNYHLKGDKEIESILEESERFFANMKKIVIPIGICHGDLTFSNILFNGNTYFLIDFLDSFIESPLIDIVKLRQDTVWHWSLLMYDNDYDAIRMKIVFDRIDREINHYFSDIYPWYREYYHPFQLMNFLRILQYAHEPKIIYYLKQSIKDQLVNI